MTSLMHLAAAVPTESGRPRQAVVVAGAREAAVWEKYPGHYFLSSDEEVECRHCWKHRHIDLPDRPGNSAAEIRCTEIANALPRCMDLISAERVIEALEFALATSVTTPLSTGQQAAAERAIALSAATGTFDEHNIHPLNALEKAERFIAAIPPISVTPVCRPGYRALWWWRKLFHQRVGLHQYAPFSRMQPADRALVFRPRRVGQENGGAHRAARREVH